MQSNSELHEIELHAVESINDLHCTNSNQEAAKPDLDRSQTRPSANFTGRERSANGLATAPLLEQGQGQATLTHALDPSHVPQDRCECSCTCCQPTCRNNVFYAVVLLLMLVSITIGLITVYYSGKMNKELKEVSHYLDVLDQSVKQMNFAGYLLQNQMNFTENMDPINNI